MSRVTESTVLVAKTKILWYFEFYYCQRALIFKKMNSYRIGKETVEYRLSEMELLIQPDICIEIR